MLTGNPIPAVQPTRAKRRKHKQTTAIKKEKEHNGCKKRHIFIEKEKLLQNLTDFTAVFLSDYNFFHFFAVQIIFGIAVEVPGTVF